MKKIISLMLALAMLMTLVMVTPVFADVAFSDVAADHWAKASIERLVSDGTVGGYSDGTFRTQGTVTRAEFVKMIGKSDKRFKKDFADVPSEHWAYDYIMHSELNGDENNNFNPDTPITREAVATLLYTRYANGEKAIAPYAISGQGENRNAVAWVYNAGLMIGDDMIDLRLEDTLTRAEAAVLIVRAKDLDPAVKRDFISNFPDELYKCVYENSDIFDTEYDPQGNITYEELSAAALRYEYRDRTPTLSHYYFAPKYDGSYATYWDVMCSYPLDEKGYESTYENGQKYVTVEDAISMLTYTTRCNRFFVTNMVKENGKTYPEVKIKNKDSEFAKTMSYAYNFGISLYADAKINPNKLITKKELGCILMQFDLLYGVQLAYYTDGQVEGVLPLTARESSATYPSNSSYYSSIVEEIPNNVYEAPIGVGKNVETHPTNYSDILSSHTKMHFTPFKYITANAREKNIAIGVTFYPIMGVKINKKGGLYRVKIDVIEAEAGKMLSDVIPLGEGLQDKALVPGESFYVDVAANQQTITTYIDYTKFTVENVIF